jgi:DUF1365 family protein
MHSALYTGRLSHRRRAPTVHAFDYRVCMAWLDLDELDEVFRDRWFWSTRRPALAWFRRSDYLGDPATPLAEAVRDRVARETGQRPTGPVRLLTHLRTFGHCFNPVSFYYCYDSAGQNVETIVAEITNTPWNERHSYVLPAADGTTQGDVLRFRFAKSFHVSPFMPMDIEYQWAFNPPGSNVFVHMTNLRGGTRIFDATLALDRREISTGRLAAALALYPLATINVLRRIYWQALLLWIQRSPFYAHPAARVTESST